VSDHREIAVTVNGRRYREAASDRMLLSDFLRQRLGLTGTHVGCEVRPGKHAVSCPGHGAVFDLEGKAIRGPAQRPLSRYAVEVEETDLVILVTGKE